MFLSEAERLLVRAEVQNDPAGMNYAGAAGIEQVYGLLTWASAGSTRPRASMSGQDFQAAILLPIARIKTLTENDQRSWDRILTVIQAQTTIALQSPGVLGLFQAGISDGIVEPAEAAAILNEPCPRVELILGRSPVLFSLEDLQAALEV